MGKNVMSGGYTAQEARNLLLIRGIEHVKAIIPHNVPKIENLAQFDDLPLFYSDGNYHEIANYEHWLWSTEGYGEIVGLRIKLDCTLCLACYEGFRNYFDALSPTLYLYSVVRRDYCGVCGKWENDDIPF